MLPGKLTQFLRICLKAFKPEDKYGVWADMPGKAVVAMFKLFITCLHVSLYVVTGYRRGPIWVQVRTHMGSRERAVMGLVPQAVRAG